MTRPTFMGCLQLRSTPLSRRRLPGQRRFHGIGGPGQLVLPQDDLDRSNVGGCYPLAQGRGDNPRKMLKARVEVFEFRHSLSMLSA